VIAMPQADIHQIHNPAVQAALVTAIGVGSQYKQHRAMPALPNWQPTQGRRWLLR
jgi:hypothetical protein